MGMVIKSNMKYSNHIVVIVIYCDYFLKFFSIFLNFSFLFILSHFLSFFNILFHVIVVFHKFLT